MVARFHLKMLLHLLMLVALAAVVGLFTWESPWAAGLASSNPWFGKLRGGQEPIWTTIRGFAITVAVVLCAFEVVFLFRETVAKKLLHLRFLDGDSARKQSRSSREARFIGPASDDPNLGATQTFPRRNLTNLAKADPARPLPFTGKRVLIADDDVDLSQSLVMRLEHLGITALRTSDALQLLFGVHKVKADLVILDVNMPTGNGLAVCEMLNSDQSLAGLPVIVYTGSSTAATVDRCRALGAHYVLKGPNSWKQIEEIVYQIFAPGETVPVRTEVDVHHAVAPRIAPVVNDSPSPPPQARSTAPQPAEVPAAEHRSPPTAPVVAERRAPVANPSPRPAPPVAAPQPVPPAPAERLVPRGTGPRGSYRVLAIHLESELATELAARSAALGIVLNHEPKAESGYWECLSETPDIVMMGTGANDSTALGVLLRLKASPLCSRIPLLAIVGPEEQSLGLSTAGYTKVAANIVDVERALREVIATLSQPAALDHLTGLPIPAAARRAAMSTIVDEPEVSEEAAAEETAATLTRNRPSILKVAENEPAEKDEKVVAEKASPAVDHDSANSNIVAAVASATDSAYADTPAEDHKPDGPSAPEGAARSDELDASAAAAPPHSADEARPARQRPLVLVIDDDVDISSAIALRLSAYGVDVLPAFAGMPGYWTAVDLRPDVILCDMRMPEGEGNYIVGRLKSHPLTQDIPVIVITGQDNLGLKRVMMTMGVAAYFSKPIVMKELLAELRRHIKMPDTPRILNQTDATTQPALV